MIFPRVPGQRAWWLDNLGTVKQSVGAWLWERPSGSVHSHAFFLDSACLSTPTNDERPGMVPRRQHNPGRERDQHKRGTLHYATR